MQGKDFKNVTPHNSMKREQNLCSYFNIHTSRVHFLCYKAFPFPFVTTGTFFVDMNILKKGAVPPIDLWLNTSLLLAPLQ
jgi:hypothetical protein